MCGEKTENKWERWYSLRVLDKLTAVAAVISDRMIPENGGNIFCKNRASCTLLLTFVSDHLTNKFLFNL